MGREAKLLLGLLGMLAFVFLGALVARLFVARPPVGLGVDVHSNVAVSGPRVTVEPPELGRPGRSAFTAVERDAEAVVDPADDPAADRPPGSSAVVPAAFEQPVEEPRPLPQPQPQLQPAPPAPPAPSRAVRQGTNCTVVAGDAWWSLAEQAYGDGRWYRAFYAWNRAIDPSVSLLPGSKLVVPTAAELEAAYPGLVPSRTPTGVGR